MKNIKKVEDGPFPVRLGEMKELLRKEAYEQDRSLHYWIRKILQEYLNKKRVA